MTKKQLQRKRVMSFFIEAVNTIIETEGIEAVSIRKVSDIAGYNSATLYNYFDNLDHLIFIASMKYLSAYTKDIVNYTSKAVCPLDRYHRIWECFCKHSFKSPKIYHILFFSHFNTDYNVEKYYSLYPEEIENSTGDILSMLLGDDIRIRNKAILKSSLRKYDVTDEDIDNINEMNILIYYGMLSRILNNTSDYSVEEATNRTSELIRISVDNYLKK